MENSVIFCKLQGLPQIWLSAIYSALFHLSFSFVSVDVSSFARDINGSKHNLLLKFCQCDLCSLQGGFELRFAPLQSFSHIPLARLSFYLPLSYARPSRISRISEAFTFIRVENFIWRFISMLHVDGFGSLQSFCFAFNGQLPLDRTPSSIQFAQVRGRES